MRKVLSLGRAGLHRVVLLLTRTNAATNYLLHASATGLMWSSVSIMLPLMLCIRTFLSTPVLKVLFPIVWELATLEAD